MGNHLEPRKTKRVPSELTGHTGPEADAADSAREAAAESAIDEAGRESFPASDPPAWTLGVAAPAGRGR